MQLKKDSGQSPGTSRGLIEQNAARYLYSHLISGSHMARVAVGGTFDPIHDGHLSLLKRAFDLSNDETVAIALTSDEMARDHRMRPVHDYEERLKNLKAAIRREFGAENYRVEKLNDLCGSAIYDDFDYIVVSPETEPVAERINKLRNERGLKPIQISVIDYQLAQDHIRISSTRISEGKIDRHGKVLSS
jgi:pantetheine-phosphate adenylyltransferase